MGRIRAIVIGVFGGIALAGGLTYTMNVGAVTCCDPWGVPGASAFIAAGNSVIGTITKSMAELSNAIETGVLDSMDNGFGKAYAETTKQTAASKTIHEGMVKAQTQLYIEGRRADALIDMPKKEDFDQTIVNSAFLAEQSGIELRNRLDLGSAAADRTIYSAYQNPALARYSRHARWCTPLGKKLGLCNAPAELGLDDADAKFQTVVGKENGLTYSDARREAAVDFAMTIVASDLRAQLRTDTPQAQQADALALADQAAMSLAANSFLDMAAERTRRNQAPLARDHNITTGSTP
ncbi:MAG: hypothetical protein WKF61_08705 [Luteimonas sp.]